jgi:hypothetical protein
LIGQAVGGAPRRDRLAGWRIASWIVLLLAAFGGVQYVRHGDYAYLLGALAVIVVCAGAILRQPWARPSLRVLALLLAAWSVATAVLMGLHWDQFEQQRQLALSQAQSPLVLLLIEQARRSYLTGLVLKALVVPLLLWLAWRLGRPEVCEQFRRPR